ncbi:hypothetical protein QVD17_15754 [Tagetes erecta]|uniref:Uncharacterized protein n=1 Tax=Tagetes erecta TaxID=13708 RepID=A0AAD8KTW1_TARER|nr:hypothetical protein QVD17_15754 [Tagetes erecta]
MNLPIADAVDHTPLPEDSKEEWCSSILKPKSPRSRMTQIPRVPMILKQHTHNDKYYVLKVVSLGPYHHGKPNFELMEGFKPLYTHKLLKGNHEAIRILYDSLSQMVPTLRGYYEDDTYHLSDDEFTRMMLLDGCFILYIIEHIIFKDETGNTLGLKSHEIMFIQEDMFLLENQIPYQVLTEVMKFVPYAYLDLKITRFIDDYIFGAERCNKRSWTQVKNPLDPTTINHLLQLLQTMLTKERSYGHFPNNNGYTFRNVTELIEVGIHFKPNPTRSLADIKFSKCGFSASLELPPITIDNSTKPILLNLVAYEMCSNDITASWVTTYICLMDSLIDHPEDVKVLRKAGILDNRIGSDEEVAQLFNEIGRDLVPDKYVYFHARQAIQKHYESKRNTWVSQLKHEYMKTPWAFVALLVGVVGLFLSCVQTYFSVWGNQSRYG